MPGRKVYVCAAFYSSHYFLCNVLFFLSFSSLCFYNFFLFVHSFNYVAPQGDTLCVWLTERENKLRVFCKHNDYFSHSSKPHAKNTHLFALNALFVKYKSHTNMLSLKMLFLQILTTDNFTYGWHFLNYNFIKWPTMSTWKPKLDWLTCTCRVQRF